MNNIHDQRYTCTRAGLYIGLHYKQVVMKNYLPILFFALAAIPGYSKSTPESPNTPNTIANAPFAVAEPSVPATNVTFSNITSTSVRVSWTSGNGNARLVVGRQTLSISRNPVDNVEYTPNANFPLGQALPGGSGNRIVYSGVGSFVDITGLIPGGTYYFGVYEYNRAGDEINYRLTGRPVGNVTTAEEDLYVVTPANGTTTNTIALTINGRGGASTYTFEVNTNSTFSGTSFIRTTDELTQRFPELQLNTQYYVRVKTNLSDVWGPTTSFVTASADKFAFLENPRTGTITTVNSLTVNLIPTAANYTIEVNTSSTFAPASAIVKTGASRIIDFSELQYGTTYYVRIKTNLTTLWGPTQTFATGPAEAYTYVVNPINRGIASQYTLTVNTVPGATQYTVEVNTTSAFPEATAIVRTSTSRIIEFPELLYDTHYYTRVKTDVSPNWGPLRTFDTNEVQFFTYLISPASGAVDVPVDVQLVPNTINGASTYEITVSNNSTFTQPIFNQTGTGTPYSPTLTGLSYGTVYYVRIRTDLSTTWGPTRSFTTVTAPGGFTVLNTEETKVYPNRFGNTLSFVVTDEQSRTASATITDAQGRPVYTSDQHTTNAVNEIQGLQNLPRGIYYLRVAYGKQIKSFRIVKE